MKLPPDNFCIWPPARPRCRACRALHGRKPIRRGPCDLLLHLPPAAGATFCLA
jgi:hypothetical protein